MLTARSVEEAHLYLDLHSCQCGESAVERSHTLDNRSGTLVAVYSGVCPTCGTPRSVEFALNQEILPAGVIGGQEASQIIDPGEFLWLSDRAASTVPVDVSELAPEALRGARESMELAAAALAEVLKFIPPDRNDVPPEAFTSDRGNRMRTETPGRFRRDEIEDRMRSYLAGVRDFAA